MQMQLALDAGFPVADDPAPPICYRTLERAMLAQPQVPTPTTHHFGSGLYMRQMFAPAGTLVLGKEHRGPCMNIMLAGRCVLIDTDGTTRELTAPQIFESPAGRKLAYVIEDMVWVNVWATRETDVTVLERDLFVDPAAANEFAQDMAEIGFTVEQVHDISTNEDDVDDSPQACVALGESPIHGVGCFSNGELAGDFVGYARLDGKRTCIGRYTNHSRTPNIEFRRYKEDVMACALRDIERGEELTVDYRQAVKVA